MEWYLKVWKNGFNFTGRARRKEYWMFALFNFIAVISIAMVDVFLIFYVTNFPVAIFTILYTFAGFIPGLALGVRRLHDIGRSGWWTLICFIPIIHLAILIVPFIPIDKGENQYGPDPKAVEE